MGETTRVDVFGDGADRGYLGGNQQWWFDPSFPDAFSVFDLDAFYEDTYFGADHVPPETVTRYVDHVLDYGRRFLGRPVESVLELGSGGGWFSKEFVRRGIDLVAVEGTHAGHARTVARIGEEHSVRHDLRRRLDLGRTFDIAVCTEVAEHIEPPFSSQLIDNLARHANVVWFSFEPPDTNDAHYHHSNEQPEKFWANLFRFYDFEARRLPAQVQQEVMDRGRHIFYRPPIAPPSGMEGLDRPEGHVALGTSRHEEPRWKRAVRLVTPPIAYALRERLRR
jgi:SAM-dependent methyltransferase